MQKTLLLALALLTVNIIQAQTVDVDSTLRQDGKIYVVVTVLVTILVGLFIYVIRTDRKISKLEDK